MNLDRDLLQAARRQWVALAITIFLGFCGGVAIILQAGQLSRILSAVFINGQSRNGVVQFIIQLLIILAIRALVTWGMDASAGFLAVNVKLNLRTQLIQHLFNLGPASVRGENAGELTNTVIQGVENLDTYFSQYLPHIALAGLIPLTILGIVFPLDWLSGLVLLLTAPLIPVFMFLIGKTAKAATQRQWTGLSRLSTSLLDSLQGLRELKLLGQSTRQIERVSAAADKYRQSTMQVLRITFLSALVLELVGTISTAIIAVQIGLRLLHGGILFDKAFFILLLAPEFYLPLRLLGQRFHAGAAGIAAANRIFGILKQPLPGGHQPDTGFRSAPVQPACVAFNHVSFGYPSSNQMAVEGVHFELHSGKLTALVGPTGAGKSTLAWLLLEFIQPTRGQILVDGVPLDSISVSSWRQRIAYVPQSPIIFRGSVAANIALGKPDAGTTEIQAAARQACLAETIDKLPKGYDTLLGEGGARLSGGEQQRLALARAFLADTPVLVMDEPTAHLDPDNEQLIQQAIQQLVKDRMVLVIAHRLPTVVKADQILVINRGRLIESGTHTQLSAADGEYSRLVRAYTGAVP
jgi:ATP-binding cassette subfamily C protein CydD